MKKMLEDKKNEKKQRTKIWLSFTADLRLCSAAAPLAANSNDVRDRVRRRISGVGLHRRDAHTTREWPQRAMRMVAVCNAPPAIAAHGAPLISSHILFDATKHVLTRLLKKLPFKITAISSSSARWFKSHVLAFWKVSNSQCCC